MYTVRRFSSIFFQAFQQILVGQDSRHFGIYILTAESGPVHQETEKGTVPGARLTVQGERV
jgi:hypothetical protein